MRLFKVVMAEEDADDTDNQAFSNPPPRISPEKPIEARTSISEAPVHRQRRAGHPRLPEAAVEGGQVRLNDESPNWELVGKAFMTFLPSCKTVVLLCGPKDVLMLFRYTENPPENTIFTPTALRVSAVASACTENSSFPYSAFPDCVLKGLVARAIRLYEQEQVGTDSQSFPYT